MAWENHVYYFGLWDRDRAAHTNIYIYIYIYAFSRHKYLGGQKLVNAAQWLSLIQ